MPGIAHKALSKIQWISENDLLTSKLDGLDMWQMHILYSKRYVLQDIISKKLLTRTRPRKSDKYHGQRDFLSLGNWTFSVDQYFILTGILLSRQGPFISMLLRDEALLWYRSSYENWDPATPLAWDILHVTMREYVLLRTPE